MGDEPNETGAPGGPGAAPEGGEPPLTGATPAPSSAPDDPTWQPAGLDGLATRLREVRDLLAQAAALAAVTELERARSLSELVHQDPRARAPVRLLPRSRS